MKKNLMSVLIFALVLVNLVFTAILTFSIVPATSNANKLIEEVASAIKLELNTGKNTGANNVAMENLVVYNVDDGATQIINLERGSDNEDYYAVVSTSLSLDSKNEDYETYYSTMKDKESLIKQAVINVVGSYSKEELSTSEGQRKACAEILERLQTLYASDFIVDVGFSSIIIQ